MQPDHEFLMIYKSMKPREYSAFFSAFREQTYKTARIYGWDINEQVKILSLFGLHTTVNVLLDIDRLTHSDSIEEKRGGIEVHNLLMQHYHYFMLILNHRIYSMLLDPITYDRLQTIRDDIVQPALNRNESLDDLLGNNLSGNMEDVARSQQWLGSPNQRMH